MYSSPPSDVGRNSFQKSEYGLTYVGPVDTFPENFYRQALHGLVQKCGLQAARTITSNEFRVLERVEATKP